MTAIPLSDQKLSVASHRPPGSSSRSIQVSGDTDRRQAPLISRYARPLPYASPSTSTYGAAEVLSFAVTGTPATI